MKSIVMILAALIAGSCAQILNIDVNCGLGSNGAANRIVGGQVAYNGFWGFTAMLYYRNEFACGASIVNGIWLVTAASCLNKAANPRDYTVHVGLNDRNNLNAWTTLHRVTKFIINNNFNPNTLYNDIAMLKIETQIKMDLSTYKVIPVCIPTGQEKYEGKNAYAIGWGHLSANPVTSRYLMEVNMPVLTTQRCSQKFAPSYSIDQYTQVCAGENGMNKGIAKFDAGGPLVTRGTNGRWHLVGIASMLTNPLGNGGIFTRVSGFANWILNTLQTN